MNDIEEVFPHVGYSLHRVQSTDLTEQTCRAPRKGSGLISETGHSILQREMEALVFVRYRRLPAENDQVCLLIPEQSTVLNIS